MYETVMSTGQTDVRIGVLNPDEASERGLSGWSLQALQTQQDTQEYYALAMEVSAVLRRLQVQRAFAPHVSAMSARIIEPSALTSRIRLGSADLYRRKELPADGVFLQSGEAFLMSAAGCPIIIAAGDEHLIAAHAGRDSLIDRKAVMGSPGRTHASVVHAIIRALCERGVPAERIVMCMQFAIPAQMFEHRFDHPVHGAYNRALGAFVAKQWPGCATERNGGLFLDLEFLFEEQAEQLGVRHAWAFNSLASFPLLAHTRDGKSSGRRNLVVVKRET